MDKKQLWLNLKGYHFDNLVPANLWDHIQATFGGTGASTNAFADKVARKAGWSPQFALKAISEYKKFVYLGVISEFTATPSMVIDKVWHEHILFSKAYREFCTNVIQYDFDHNPELVPMKDQTGTFNAQYLDTIQLYKTEFGVDPPASIWSIPKFDKEYVSTGYRSQKKRSNAGYADDTPLYMSFVSAQRTDDSNGYPEFYGFDGGSGGGSGASGEFSDSIDSGTGSDSSDPGSGCSSCSSGCGGGGD